MFYQTFAPSALLAPYVKYFWSLTGSSEGNDPRKFTAFVDGSPGIMIVQSANQSYYLENGKRLSDVFVYGQVAKPVSFTTYGNINTIGVCFQPHALKSVFGLNAFELTDACVDIKLINQKSNDLHALITEEETIPNRIRILSKHLTDLIMVNHRRCDNDTLYAVSEILNVSGALPLKTLQRQLQLSERSLERKFNEAVGVSPKFFSRICQFQTAMNQIRRKGYHKFSDIAFENNYSDQSHFIRVFKTFTGLLPLEYRNDSFEVVENFAALKH